MLDIVIADDPNVLADGETGMTRPGRSLRASHLDRSYDDNPVLVGTLNHALSPSRMRPPARRKSMAVVSRYRTSLTTT